MIREAFQDLSQNLYWNTGANIIQWTTILVWGYAVVVMYHVSCDAHLWCWRPGRHRVTGTSWKTCSNHKTETIHREMHIKHREKHPDRHGNA